MTVLTIKGYSLLQTSIGVDNLDTWLQWPYMSVTAGYNTLFSFYCSLGRVYFDFDLLSRNWTDD